MVDFRYHLVSLISVFLALAVGIVLGAGPLRGTISDQLTGQVEQLRIEKEELRAQLDTAQTQVRQDEAYLRASAPRLLAGALPQYRVALVMLPGASSQESELITERVEQAGAEVVTRLEATDLWAGADQGAYRERAAASLAAIIPTEPGDSALETLASGLAIALTGSDALAPRTPSATAVAALGVLAEGQESLILGEVVEPADLVLVVSGVVPEPTEQETVDPERALERQSWSEALLALATDVPTVVAGHALSGSDLLPELRSTGGVTTVDGIDRLQGQLSVPLALAAVAAGTPATAYGFGIGALEAAPPAVSLLPPAWLTPVPDTGEAGTDGQSGEGAQGELPGTNDGGTGDGEGDGGAGNGEGDGGAGDGGADGSTSDGGADASGEPTDGAGSGEGTGAEAELEEAA